MKLKLGIAAAYFGLLAASHLTSRHPVKIPPSPDTHFASVHRINRGEIESATIRLAYRDTATASDGVPVVLVHGSPGSGEVLRRLSDLLAPHFRVIVPDLPGFGSSEHVLPDYSFRSHGEYLIELLDALRVSKAHLVGFSMGGGVVLSLADLDPKRVASITMLSAIGLQKHELTGSYLWNHVLHGAQLSLLILLRDGVPHFGLFHRLPYTIEYARNFYDSDQRPLRAVLEAHRGPMLIIHGTKDRNVPIAAAREHHRLVPQSEILELDGNHFMAFQRPEVFTPQLIRFLGEAQIH